MADARIDIDMSKPCPRCGKMGAANGGPCLKCILKALDSGEIRPGGRRRKRSRNAQ